MLEEDPPGFLPFLLGPSHRERRQKQTPGDCAPQRRVTTVRWVPLSPTLISFSLALLRHLADPFWLTNIDVLGDDRQRVSLLLRLDENRDSRGCCDLPEKAAHALRGLLQQRRHILC